MGGLIDGRGQFALLFVGNFAMSLVVAAALHCAVEPAIERWRRRNKSRPTDGADRQGPWPAAR
jgi:peptidoglycan/LPS O-acetylase OafA/YrhL